jgi:hypothetical protein
MKKSFVFPLLLAAGLAVEGVQADALAVDPNDINGTGTPTQSVTRGYAFTVAPGFQLHRDGAGCVRRNP